MKGVSLLGATGSIGTSTLDVLERHPDRYRVEALTANRDVASMVALCTRLRPRVAAMADASAAGELARELAAARCPTEVLAGMDGLVAAATIDGAEIVVAATAEDFAADEGHHTMHVVRRIDETFMRGLGHKNHRTPTPAPSRSQPP